MYHSIGVKVRGTVFSIFCVKWLGSSCTDKPTASVQFCTVPSSLHWRPTLTKIPLTNVGAWGSEELVKGTEM